MSGMWQVQITKKVLKQIDKLPLEIQMDFSILIESLRSHGPMLPKWKNFGKLKGYGLRFHCHIKSGRPTYVVCWEVIDKNVRILEVYYVGTHENTPY